MCIWVPCGIIANSTHAGRTEGEGSRRSRNMPVSTYTTLDDPRANFRTDPTAINDAGTIVGTYVDLTGNHGFLYSGGTYATLDAPGPPGRPAHPASTRRV